MDTGELLAGARVVAVPLRERFRGIDSREALLIAGSDGTWAEWSPFVEYGDSEATIWLGAALEALGSPPGGAARGAIVRVNATLPAVDPDAVPGVLARFAGARTVKVKVAQAGQGLTDDIARVRAVRDVLGPSGRIRVDANAAWSLDEATTALTALADYSLEYAEQPVASVSDLAELRHRMAGAVAIAADESIRKAADPIEVVRADAADVIVLKAQPLGGVRTALEIARLARSESDVAFVTSSALETSVGLAAAMELAIAIDERYGDDLDHGLGTAALLAGDVTEDPLLPEQGAIALRPVHPDPDLLDRWSASPGRTAFWLDRLRRCLAEVQLDAGRHSPL